MLSSTGLIISGSEYSSGRAEDDTSVSGKVDIFLMVVCHGLGVTARVVTGTVLAISTRKVVSALEVGSSMEVVCHGVVSSSVFVVNPVVAIFHGDVISSVKTVDAGIDVSPRDIVDSVGVVPPMEVVSSAESVAYVVVGSACFESDSSMKKKKRRKTPHTWALCNGYVCVVATKPDPQG